MNQTRAAAMAAREPTYFTGLPCMHGHIAPRHTQCGSCTECVKLRNARRRIGKLPTLRERVAEVLASQDLPISVLLRHMPEGVTKAHLRTVLTRWRRDGGAPRVAGWAARDLDPGAPGPKLEMVLSLSPGPGVARPESVANAMRLAAFPRPISRPQQTRGPKRREKRLKTTKPEAVKPAKPEPEEDPAPARWAPYAPPETTAPNSVFTFRP